MNKELTRRKDSRLRRAKVYSFAKFARHQWQITQRQCRCKFEIDQPCSEQKAGDVLLPRYTPNKDVLRLVTLTGTGLAKNQPRKQKARKGSKANVYNRRLKYGSLLKRSISTHLCLHGRVRSKQRDISRIPLSLALNTKWELDALKVIRLEIPEKSCFVTSVAYFFLLLNY